MAGIVAPAVVRCHLRTMERLGIEYDLLPRESEILHLKFWDAAFEHLKAAQRDPPRRVGQKCRMLGHAHERCRGRCRRERRRRRRQDHRALEWHRHLRRKGYRLPALEIRPARAAISTTRNFTPIRTATRSGPAFPAAAIRTRPRSDMPRSCTTSSMRGRLILQNVVVAGLRALGFQEQADRSIHFSYEIVALTPRCAAELGYTLSEEDAKKPYVEVSGRKGLGVKADDLIDRLEAAAQRRGGSAPSRIARERTRGDRACHCHRRAAIFPAQVHAHGDHRLRLQGRAQLRR